MGVVEWRLINVFSIGDGKILGACCPTVDFEEGILELSRKALVVGHATAEAAPWLSRAKPRLKKNKPTSLFISSSQVHRKNEVNST